MKILINTSTLNGGGGVQVALSFIEELRHMDSRHKYYIFLSKAIDAQVDQKDFSDNFAFFLIEKTPASLFSRREVLTQMNKLEKQIYPDIVFSVFGPSYWRPKGRHLIGFADGWTYNPESVAYKRLPLLRRIKMRLHAQYKIYYLKRDADYYVLETNDAKQKLAQTAGLDLSNIFIVGNTHSSVFYDNKYLDENNTYYIKLPRKAEKEFRLVFITNYKPNKNLEIINKLLPLLKDHSVKFVLTLDEKDFQKLNPTSTDKLINIGPIAHSSCPSVYMQCDALFAPTLLETFSAAYPEAMKMKKPILTSDYSFAKDVCDEAALYFDPLNPKDIAQKIIELLEDKNLQQGLIEKGEKRVKEFETARSRAEKYIKLCVRIANGENK